MKVIHRTWGEVQIDKRFSSHVNIMTKQGIHQCHESDLTYITDEADTPEMLAQHPASAQQGTEMPPVPLFAVNLATPAQLFKQFRQLGKLNCQRIIERAPYQDVDDMVTKCTDLFESPELIRTVAEQMTFALPHDETNMNEETA